MLQLPSQLEPKAWQSSNISSSKVCKKTLIYLRNQTHPVWYASLCQLKLVRLLAVWGYVDYVRSIRVTFNLQTSAKRASGVQMSALLLVTFATSGLEVGVPASIVTHNSHNKFRMELDNIWKNTKCHSSKILSIGRLFAKLYSENVFCCMLVWGATVSRCVNIHVHILIQQKVSFSERETRGIRNSHVFACNVGQGKRPH